MSVSNEGDARSTSGADEYRYERAPDERPSDAVVTAVAEATGRPAVPYETSDDGAPSLSPLYEHLDPDALDALLPTDGAVDRDCSVTFRYDGYAVTVQPWTVTVTPDV